MYFRRKTTVYGLLAQTMHRAVTAWSAASFVFLAAPAHADTRAVFYAGFNDNVISAPTTQPIYNEGVVFDQNGKIQQGMRSCKGLSTCSSGRFRIDASALVDPRRGSLTFWIKLNPNQPMQGGYYPIFMYKASGRHT